MDSIEEIAFGIESEMVHRRNSSKAKVEKAYADKNKALLLLYSRNGSDIITWWRHKADVYLKDIIESEH